MKIIRARTTSPPQAKIFKGVFKAKTRNLSKKRSQIWFLEKSKIIKARRRRNFFENNKNLTRFLSEFLKIIKTYAKIRSPKILKGGVLIIYTPVLNGFQSSWALGCLARAETSENGIYKLNV